MRESSATKICSGTSDSRDSQLRGATLTAVTLAADLLVLANGISQEPYQASLINVPTTTRASVSRKLSYPKNKHRVSYWVLQETVSLKTKRKKEKRRH